MTFEEEGVERKLLDDLKAVSDSNNFFSFHFRYHTREVSMAIYYHIRNQGYISTIKKTRRNFFLSNTDGVCGGGTTQSQSPSRGRRVAGGDEGVFRSLGGGSF